VLRRTLEAFFSLLRWNTETAFNMSWAPSDPPISPLCPSSAFLIFWTFSMRIPSILHLHSFLFHFPTFRNPQRHSAIIWPQNFILHSFSFKFPKRSKAFYMLSNFSLWPLLDCCSELGAGRGEVKDPVINTGLGGTQEKTHDSTD